MRVEVKMTVKFDSVVILRVYYLWGFVHVRHSVHDWSL